MLFRPNGDTIMSPIPAVIHEIESREGEVILTIRRHAPATDFRNPFATFAHFPAKLYSANLLSASEKIPLSWIHCHFARYKWSEDHVVVVLSLSRVSCYLLGNAIAHSSTCRIKLIFDP